LAHGGASLGFFLAGVSKGRMPTKKKKGGKRGRRSKNVSSEQRGIVFQEPGQVYAQALRMLGGGRLEAMCFDGTTRLAHIRGSMRKKVWVRAGNILLLSLREFQDEKADVIHRYTDEEARQLKAYGELPEYLRLDSVIDDTMTQQEKNDDMIDFEDI
jgi:translation initiation factor 1A